MEQNVKAVSFEKVTQTWFQYCFLRVMWQIKAFLMVSYCLLSFSAFIGIHFQNVSGQNVCAWVQQDRMELFCVVCLMKQKQHFSPEIQNYQSLTGVNDLVNYICITEILLFCNFFTTKLWAEELVLGSLQSCCVWLHFYCTLWGPAE